jgi:hypothetical protein
MSSRDSKKLKAIQRWTRSGSVFADSAMAVDCPRSLQYASVGGHSLEECAQRKTSRNCAVRDRAGLARTRPVHPGTDLRCTHFALETNSNWSAADDALNARKRCSVCAAFSNSTFVNSEFFNCAAQGAIALFKARRLPHLPYDCESHWC